jgi:hypothetical protein
MPLGKRHLFAGVARVWTRLASAAGLAGVWGPTDGCIGVANEDAELLFAAAPIGTKVVIFSTRPAPRDQNRMRYRPSGAAGRFLAARGVLALSSPAA